MARSQKRRKTESDILSKTSNDDKEEIIIKLKAELEVTKKREELI